MRIASLTPPATEIIRRIGGAGMLVGCSHACGFANGPLGVPVLTSPRRPAGGGPEHGECAWHLDGALLRSLAPDVVVTHHLRHVCPIDAAALCAAAAGLEHPPSIVTLSAATVEGVLDDVLTVGRAVGLQSAALAEVVSLRARLFQAQDHVNPYDDGPAVVFLEGTDPPVAPGLWTAQLVERAGARHPLNPTRIRSAEDGSGTGPQQAFRVAGPARRVSPEEVAAARPEFLVVCPWGEPLERAVDLAAALARHPWWAGLPAVRHGRAAVLDGRAMLPGPRLAEALEWMVGWLHGPRHMMPEGFAWATMGAQ